VALRDQLAGWDERLLGQPGQRRSAADAGPSLVLSLGVLAFGVAVALAGALGTWRALAPTLFTSSAYPVPATIERHLDKGDYEVYQRTGTHDRVPGFSTTEEAPITIGPNDVAVVGPDGNPLAVEIADMSETVSRDRATYTGAVWFHVSDAGTYRINIRSSGGFDEVLITSTIGDAFRRAALWLATAVVGGLAAVTGLVLLLVGVSRRRRGVGPGWYADPGGSGRLRWWNGNAWTEHIW